MKHFFSAALICVVALSACTTPFKKAKDGTNYKIITNNNGAKIDVGNYMELENLVKYKDSVLKNTREEGMPIYAGYDTATYPSPYKEIFKLVHVGDSIVVKTATDSIIAKKQAAPFMVKGQYLYQYFKITNVYKTKEAADSAQKTHIKVAKAKYQQKQLESVEKDLAANKTLIETDSKTIESYLAKNNIKATKAKWGTYVVINKEGTGANLTANDVASVNYTGKTFDSSKVFDSNTDPKFNHTQPYDVSAGQVGGVILGWTDALTLLKKGTKATIYIPSALAYGKSGNPQGGIKPNAILVFDMEVVNVTTEEEAMAKQQKQQEAQQRMMDSMRKVAPQAAPKH